MGKYQYINIIIAFCMSFLVLNFFDSTFAACDGNFPGDASTFLQGCATSSTSTNYIPNTGGNDVTAIKGYIIDISQQVIQYGALFAIGAIVFSGIQYTTSYGEDEKVKKAKMTGIYSLIGLLLLLIAFPLVNIIVNFIYSLGT